MKSNFNSITLGCISIAVTLFCQQALADAPHNHHSKNVNVAEELPSSDQAIIGSTIVFEASQSFYGVRSRETTRAGYGAYVTCDSSEIALGAFCEEAQRPSEPNALLDSGLIDERTAYCRWQQIATYTVRVNCMAFKSIVGDSKSGEHSAYKK
jgi:hypothetical protein